MFLSFLDQDGAEPNPNSVAVCNLLRLSNILVDITLQDKAVKILSLYSHRMLMLPMALPEMLCGLMFYSSNFKQVSVGICFIVDNIYVNRLCFVEFFM